MPKDRASKRLKQQQTWYHGAANEPNPFTGEIDPDWAELFGPPRYPAQDDPCEPAPISEENYPELWAAFRAFDLNPRQNVAWQFLANQMAKVLFPQAGKPGRPKNSGRWDSYRRAKLARDVADIQAQHPAWNKRRIAVELKNLGKRSPIDLYSDLAEKTLYGLLTKRR